MSVNRRRRECPWQGEDQHAYQVVKKGFDVENARFSFAGTSR